ncbi:MAG: hypothetical protein KAR42_04710 [candidate division Zixibacteria bacterium]|nr:hypothetical protein [candidate division Zixibacteria bacterium]
MILTHKLDDRNITYLVNRGDKEFHENIKDRTNFYRLKNLVPEFALHKNYGVLEKAVNNVYSNADSLNSILIHLISMYIEGNSNLNVPYELISIICDKKDIQSAHYKNHKMIEISQPKSFGFSNLDEVYNILSISQLSALSSKKLMYTVVIDQTQNTINSLKSLKEDFKFDDGFGNNSELAMKFMHRTLRIFQNSNRNLCEYNWVKNNFF